MNEAPSEEQPIGRTVGRRRPSPPGAPPGPDARRALASLARYRTRAPKGVFRYANHEEMAADRDRWTVDAIVARAQAR